MKEDMDDTDVPALLAMDLDHHFKYVVSTYQHRLYAFALRQTASPQEAEDIVQDALIQAYFALRNYPAQRIQTLILQPWLYRIVINVFYSRRRRLHIQFVPFDSSEDSPLLEIEDLSRKPDEELWWQERRRELEMLVATLPERYRVAVNLHYFEELSYQEIADLLDIPQVFCPHDPFKRVNLSKRIGGYTITIARGYADANQIIIEYIVTRDADHRQVFADLSSTLRMQKGGTLRGNASFGAFDPKKKLGSEAMVFDFDAANIPAKDTKELSLQLIINSINNITDPSAAPTRVTGALPIPVARNPVTFAFSLPFNSGRVVILHKTVTVAGVSVTLERMVATPSETRFDVQGKQVTLDNSFSLSDDGKSVDDIDASVGGITDRNGNTIVTIPSTSVILNFGPLFSNHAVCTFTVSAPNGKHSGPWIFHFVVP